MILIILIALGLSLGSFINALVWRLHEQTKVKGKGSKSRNLSIFNGRSMCPNCRHKLAANDLVPVLSWLWLKGKCRYCNKPISIQYPAVELLTAALFVFSYLYWPFAWGGQGTTIFVFWIVFLVGLLGLAIYDIKWQLLPNKVVFVLMYLAVLQALLLVFVFHGGLHQLEQIVLSFVVGGGLFYMLFQISSGKWIGGGDVKLGMLLGLLLANPSLSVFMIFVASLLGSAVSIPLLATKKVKRTTRIPFGPFLIAGTIIARLFGQSIITWYRHKLLI
ncbi:MAG TPA: prepilin peptidase [Patescibacteria group bacterium]|nr:prepilin peptidase [Patescibacteria group bacterium]